MVFLADDKIWLHDHNQGYLLDLATEQVQPVALPKPGFSYGAWLPVKEAFALTTLKETHLIHARDGNILQTFNSPERTRMFDLSGNRGTNALSTQDESMVILSMKRSVHPRDMITFWNVKTGNLVGQIEVPEKDIRSLALTPDGKTLAVGHGNTAISLWDVEKALQNATPTQPDPALAQGGTTKKRALNSVQNLPEQPLSDGTHLWSFQKDGSCSVDGKMPSFARLRVLGRPWKVEYASHWRDADPNAAPAFPASPVLMEGSVEDEQIHVSRRLGSYFAMGPGNSVFATDGLTHYGMEERSLDVVYEMQYPSDTQGLLTDHSKAVAIPADGNFLLTEDQHWLAPSDSGKLDEKVAVVRVKHWSSRQTPTLHWNSKSKVLSIKYRVVLPPGETVWLAHALTLAKRLEGDSLNALNYEDHGELGYLTLTADLNQAGNFGSPWQVEKPLHHRLVPRFTGAFTNQAPSPNKDGLGQVWEPRQDGGRQGELGANSILQPWFTGRPAASGAGRLIRPSLTESNNAQRSSPPLQFSALSQPIRLQRRHHDSDNGLSTVWADSLVNSSTEPQQTTINYVTTFKSPVVAVYDALGREYTRDTLPTTGENFGGALAFVLSGEHKPATLLAFHHGKAQLFPSIRWMGPQAVALDFAIQLDPAKPVTLLLGACQRPLQAFGSSQEAFGDWLPLTMPPPFQSNSQSQLRPPIQALNYQLDSD